MSSRYQAPMKLLFASRNAHKVIEIRELLEPHGFEIVSLIDHPEIPDIEEMGLSFEENALIKARAGFEFLGLTTIADDSGLCVDALDGAPGLYSKRFSPEATAVSNNDLLLSKLTAHTQRTARYTCAMAILTPTGAHTFVETCEGVIGREPLGDGGFGYDPLFWPEDAPERTMAQLSMSEKNQLSHRGKAVRRLPQILREIV
jgi:XTP/dITP diphosphohydrolase